MHPYISRILQISFIQIFFYSFSLRNTCLPCRLRKTYVYSWQPTILFAWRHLNTMHLTLSTKILKIQIPPRTISRNTQFLSFDGLSHYLYLLKIEPAFVPLKKNRRQKYLWPGERSSSHLKVTKMRSSPDIKYLSGPFVDFCCREGISCFV